MKVRLFSAHEKKDLTRLLSKAVNPEDVFNIEELHGFLFGLAITPELINPGEWLPVVFGEEMMEFEDEEEAGEMMAPLFLVCNRFYEEHHKGKLFLPFSIGDLETGDLTRISDWAHGLYQAMALRPETWTTDRKVSDEEKLTEDEQELVSSCGIIIGVADPDKIPEIFEKEDFDPEANEEDLHLEATLFALLPSAVATLQSHAKQKGEKHQAFMSLLHQPANSTLKIGRNEPCPCGSGKKFKKCCGKN
jgi:uncharacterized protein